MQDTGNDDLIWNMVMNNSLLGIVFPVNKQMKNGTAWFVKFSNGFAQNWSKKLHLSKSKKDIIQKEFILSAWASIYREV